MTDYRGPQIRNLIQAANPLVKSRNSAEPTVLRVIQIARKSLMELVERKGIEPSTFALRTRLPSPALSRFCNYLIDCTVFCLVRVCMEPGHVCIVRPLGSHLGDRACRNRRNGPRSIEE
jgi:hypothetical protein